MCCYSLLYILPFVSQLGSSPDNVLLIFLALHLTARYGRKRVAQKEESSRKEIPQKDTRRAPTQI
jgi:hypothetical protein